MMRFSLILSLTVVSTLASAQDTKRVDPKTMEEFKAKWGITVESKDPAALYNEFQQRLAVEADRLLVKLKDASPNSSWGFEPPRDKVRRELDNLLSNGLGLLGNGQLKKLKEQSDQIQRESALLKRQQIDLQTALPGAPSKKNSSWGDYFAQSDRQSIEKRLKEIEEKIAENDKRVEQIVRQIFVVLDQQGIQLNKNQISVLVYSVSGREDVELLATYDNVRILTQILKVEMQKSGGNTQLASKYFGMHCILVRYLILLNEDYLRRLEAEYLPRLDKIRSENTDLIRVAQSTILDQSLSSESRNQLNANIQSLELTGKTANLYRRLLELNQLKVKENLRQLNEKYAVAEHTYLTVKQAAQLIVLMNEAKIDGLLSLEVPKLAEFSNAEMLVRFNEISEQLRAGR